MSKTPSAVALIPARSGSKRVADKNIRLLAGHPVIAYTIAAARQSGVFSAVIVSTDSERYADIARYYGAEVPFLRPPELAGDLSPDSEWIEYTLRRLSDAGRVYDCFSILRPTSPFRQAETIRRAWGEFMAAGNVDSLRAIEKCKQHPGKMWIVRNGHMLPLLPFSNPNGQPWHSCQTQTLPEMYIQNASLEIARVRVIYENRNISGEVVLPFFTYGHEGFDINQPEDWKRAENLLATNDAELPVISVAVYTPSVGKEVK